MAEVRIFKRVSIEAQTVGDVYAWLNALDDDVQDDTQLTEPGGVMLEIEIDTSSSSDQQGDAEEEDAGDEDGGGG